MEKRTELKDVIHFYIGCKVTHVTRDKEVIDIERMIGVSESEMHPGQITVITSDNHTEWAVSDVLPILRRLSSMTEEEGNEICFRYFGERTTEDWTGDTGSAYFRPKQIQAGKAHALRIIEGQDYSTGDFMTVVSIVPYLLSKGFDLFNLIDSSQAIEQTPEKS